MVAAGSDHGRPVAAKLAERAPGLIEFAQTAGRNMLEVIPIETTRQTYLRGPLRIHWIMDPATITELLTGAGRSFPKARFTRDIIGPAVGNGMILSEGDKWKAQRKRYAPLFAARNLPMLVDHFAQNGQELARRLTDGRGSVDVALAAKDATLANICRVMFSGGSVVDPVVIRAGLTLYFEHISKISLFDLMGLPSWVPRAKWLRDNAPVTTMRALAQVVIEERRAARRETAEDFLDLLVEALDEDFEDIDTTVDNLLTFVVAGHETSANALAWGLYLLALYPDVQHAVREEVRAACGDGPVSFAAVEAMPKLRAHVRETLRLYPSAAFFARDAGADLEFGGTRFRKGDALFFPVYSLHRNAALWEAPDDYRPDRFLGPLPPRGQYILFGDGPRICIGAHYAEAEIMVLMASAIRNVQLSVGDHPVPRPILTFTMRPEGPLVLDATPC